MSSGGLHVTFMAKSWGSPNDEVSMINRELAKHFAKCPNVETVTVFVLPGQPSEAKEDAAMCGVQLLEAKKFPGVKDTSLQLFSFSPPDIAVDVVIGYGTDLGPSALSIKNAKKPCKWVQFVYESSEELGIHGEDSAEYEKKHKAEIALCAQADLVVAIGPKVAETYSASLRHYQKSVEKLIPGILDELCKSRKAETDGKKFNILAFGRDALKDYNVKGYDIAAEAVGGMRQGKYNLTVVGAPDGKHEEIKGTLVKYINKKQLRVRSFPGSREELLEMFSEFDLCIMPSRTEGFGLTALEALSAGVPILVTWNSGFGDALEEVRFGSTVIVCSDEPGEWRRNIDEVLEKDRPRRLLETEGVRDAYNQKYQWLEQCNAIVQKICALQSFDAGSSVETVQGIKPTAEVSIDQKLKHDGALPLTNYRDGAPTLKELRDLSGKIVECWFELGIELEEEEAAILSIRSDNVQFPSTHQKALEMLRKWRNKGVSSYQKLAEALIKLDYGLLAQFCYSCHNDK